MKKVIDILYKSLSVVLVAVAMTNVGTTSMFLLYEPDVPDNNLIVLNSSN